MQTARKKTGTLHTIRRLIESKWPEAAASKWAPSGPLYSTGIPRLDRLFEGGLPAGQIIEITGDVSSGKTTLLTRLVRELAVHFPVAYLDFARTFFPAAAVAGGIDPARLLITHPASLGKGLRTAELLFADSRIGCAVLDLAGIRTPLSAILLHRLRNRTAGAGKTVLFLTEPDARLISASTVSLRLEVARADAATITIAITKSRLGGEGVTFTWSPDGG